MKSYTHALTHEQVRKLRALLEQSGFEFAPKEWTIFFAQKNKLSVAAYKKGPKVLAQGRGVEEFVQFELEPKVLAEAKLGYEEVHSPEMFEPHFGVDESGKGDFFGPLVISGVYVDRGIARKPGCQRSLSDQFADVRVIEASLLRHGRNVVIEQRPRAESDIAVAAASIVAREAFINWLERKGKELGMRLQRGVSAVVKETAKKLVETNGPDALREVAKVHFRTAHEIAPDYYPAPTPRENWAGPRLPRRSPGEGG